LTTIALISVVYEIKVMRRLYFPTSTDGKVKAPSESVVTPLTMFLVPCLNNATSTYCSGDWVSESTILTLTMEPANRGNVITVNKINTKIFFIQINYYVIRIKQLRILISILLDIT